MRKVGFTAYDRALKVAEAAAAKPGEAVPPPDVDETAPPPKSGADKKKPKGKSKKPPAKAKAEVIENASDGGDVSEAQPEPGNAVGDGA